MCNKIKFAIQYTMNLINNNINRDVQEECANRLYWVHKAAIRMMENSEEQFIKLSPVIVIRPSLSLGAWWPFCHHAPEAFARWL